MTSRFTTVERVTIIDDEDWPSEQAMQFIQTRYWVRPSHNKSTLWKFSLDEPKERLPPNVRWRRPTLDDVVAARWDGRFRKRTFLVARNDSGGVSFDCPVQKARSAAKEYLERHQVDASRLPAY